MKIVMYGTEICPDCVEAKQILKKYPNYEVDYRDITKSTKILKEFLFHRDHDELFVPVIKDGRIGIPFFELEDGRQTLDIYDVIDIERPEQIMNTCSIDGKGNC